ncbi:DUF3883 domain-containing protein [Sphingobacterium puteale]|uniref:DUF3883 domain-containing protein n=1 Tax=Sphingobacterium puteale TaxID=2420510 RepID=A0A420W1W7_9SPHI|nr:DUF3883 domain-containing protein [Sphingobacterium puteale]RKO72551.1 DUF3883 domain-containing protein [Sphingobacterium puteale]
MMNEKEFINNLTQHNSDYNNPELAITTSNLCDTISRDINTDSQRFIYELLQNADDSSNESGSLDVRIDFINEFVVFSHSGAAFTTVDIESISSAGDGTKTGDDTKTGFKGIGFKSVFSHSKLVYIKSGNYCFKFDRNHWKEHWNNHWGDKALWQSERRSKNKEENIKMPWQIIPIWSDLPEQVASLAALSQYNVSTVIAYDKIEELKSSLNDLFSDSQIVLFLRSRKVKIAIYSDEPLVLEKSTDENITSLVRNDIKLSDWLIKTETFQINEEIKAAISADDKSPKKLREAKFTEIAFAVQLEEGRLRAVDVHNRLIFTYLPTSVNYNLPFLVNGSFLTDAGRQQLHQDVVWNNWLFNEIPLRYFSWVAELAHKDSAYRQDILAIIPSRLFGNQLSRSFNEGLGLALSTIAFIPNHNGDLLKIDESIYDRSAITQVIDDQLLIDFINEDSSKDFTISSFIPPLEPIGSLISLGIYTFNVDQLQSFISSSFFRDNFSVSDNFGLIDFFYEQQSAVENEYDKKAFNDKLKSIPFIFDENEKLKSPNEIYFPAKEYAAEFAGKISVVHHTVMADISRRWSTQSWLIHQINIKEPSSLVFIERTIIERGDEFVTTDNAIAIGRYIFEAHRNGTLKDHHYRDLYHLPVLSSSGKLLPASSAYLSDIYEPTLKIESLFDNDFYISGDYIDKDIDKREWGSFFIKIGVKEDVGVVGTVIDFRRNSSWINRHDAAFLEKVKETAGNIYNNSGKGWTFGSGEYGFFPDKTYIYSLTFLELANLYPFSKLLFERVFSVLKPIDLKPDHSLSVSGSFGFINKSINPESLERFGCPANYTKWLIENSSVFPTVKHECKKASEIILNSEDNNRVGKGYLNVLDYSGILSPEWKEFLNFKEVLTIDDYLFVLGEIWKKYVSSGEEVSIDDKDRINLIYEKMSAELLHESEKEKIILWSRDNKLLAKNGTDFLRAGDLVMVTVEGFNAENLVYSSSQKQNIVELMKIFGVQIINAIHSQIPYSTEILALKRKIKHISPLIALVAVEKSKSHKDWELEYQRINNKLSEIRFFQTAEIYLTYGNDTDRQKRSSWAEDDSFYYVGDCFSPRILDGLVGPLGKFLKVHYAERILNVLLLESFANGLEYLEEKGYDTSMIPFGLSNTEELEIGYVGNNNRIYNQSDEDLGKLGELAVFNKLKQIYSAKYSQPLENTDFGFRVSDSVEVYWRNIDGATIANHDFKIVEDGKEIYVDSKATPYGKNMEKLALYISGNELNLMEQAEKYLIARVYHVTTDPVIEFVKLALDNSFSRN